MNNPVIVLANFFANQRFEKFALADALDRFIEFVDFCRKRIQCLAVVNGSTSVNLELAIDIG